MATDADGHWIPNLFPKQIEVFNSRARALLVPGPRLSGKTRGVLHRLARHLWEIESARLGFFARTKGSSKDGGSWALLINSILPEWFNARFGMKFTTETRGMPGQKTDGVTRTPLFRVRNRHKGESECMLFSLDNDDDVEAKLKEKEFSCIYFSELDKFGDRRVLTVGLPSLRMGHLKYEDQFWIADCNPSEEGDQSWIYKTFIREKNMSYAEYVAAQQLEDLPVLSQEDFEQFYAQLQVIEILPADNPWVDPRQLQEVRVSCGADQGLYARHVLGKWVWGGGDASRHFRALFGDGSRYIVGSIEGPEEDWIYLNPSPVCFELVLGFDLGETNHAAVCIDRQRINGDLHFFIVHELVSIGKEVSIEDFTETFLEDIVELERVVGRKFDLTRSWSDQSALQKYSSSGDTYPYLQVQAASGGRIVLQEVHKAQAPNSRRVRVQMLRELLAHCRIHISAHCIHTIAMFRNLKKGKDKTNFVVSDEHKHVFDALSYACLAELAEELETKPSVGHRVAQPLSVQVR